MLIQHAGSIGAKRERMSEQFGNSVMSAGVSATNFPPLMLSEVDDPASKVGVWLISYRPLSCFYFLLSQYFLLTGDQEIRRQCDERRRSDNKFPYSDAQQGGWSSSQGRSLTYLLCSLSCFCFFLSLYSLLIGDREIRRQSGERRRSGNKFPSSDALQGG